MEKAPADRAHYGNQFSFGNGKSNVVQDWLDVVSIRVLPANGGVLRTVNVKRNKNKRVMVQRTHVEFNGVLVREGSDVCLRIDLGRPEVRRDALACHQRIAKGLEGLLLCEHARLSWEIMATCLTGSEMRVLGDANHWDHHYWKTKDCQQRDHHPNVLRVHVLGVAQQVLRQKDQEGRHDDREVCDGEVGAFDLQTLSDWPDLSVPE
jgi:hypothetical protein